MVAFLKKYLILEKFEQELSSAIDNHQVVTLHYAGSKDRTNPTIAGIRHILPVALGTNKAGSTVVRAYLVSQGIETTGRGHNAKSTLTNPATKYGENNMDRWKTFRTDRITNVIPREGPNDVWEEAPIGYNESGDGSMIDVQKQAVFNGVQTAPTETIPIEPAPVTKPIQPASKLEKIPDNTKVVIKPKAEKPVVKPQPVKQPQTNQTVQQPQTNQTVQPEVPEEPNPEDNQPKPIGEWYLWLNKILKN